jgi:hypothetical protein
MMGSAAHAESIPEVPVAVPASQPFPVGVTRVLQWAAIAGASLIALYPFVPAEWVTAMDPYLRQPFVIQITHQNVLKVFILTWSLEGYVQHLVVWALLPAVLTAVCRAAATRLSPDPLAPSSSRLRWWAIAAFGVAFFLVTPVDYALNARFGDGPGLPAQVVHGDIFGAEVATMHLAHLCYWLGAKVIHSFTGQDAFLLMDIIVGVGFFVAMHSIAVSLAENIWERWLLFFGLSASGAAVMFCGYVETTQVELCAIAWYCAAAVRVAQEPEGSSLTAARLSATGAVGLACIAHGAGVLLLPSLAVLLTSPGGFLKRLRRLVSGDVQLMGWIAVGLPFLLIVVGPFYSRGDLGNGDGGADHILFVPMHFDYSQPVSGMVYYAMFSWWHLLEISNAVWLTASAAAPLLVAGLLLKRREPLSPEARRMIQALGVATLSCAVIPLAWNHDYGMWGDWNIATCYLFPLNVVGWVLFVTLARPYVRSARFYVGTVAPLVVIQLGAALGLYLQFR